MKAIRSRRLAFTLIELLVVISIIAVLASLTFTGVGTAMLAAKKVQAKNDMAQICNGVQFYYTEYGKYPTGTPVMSGSDAVYGVATGDNHTLIDILRCTSTFVQSDTASATPQNPRQIQFLQPKVIGMKKGGVNSTDGNWYDPWGTQYIVFVDAAYDGDITVSSQFPDITTNPSFGVGAASAGYYYAKKNTPTAVYGANVKFSDNRTTILLSWQ